MNSAPAGAHPPGWRTPQRVIATLLAVGLGLAPVGLGYVHGGYFPSTWMTFALVFSALVLVIGFGLGGRHPALLADLRPGAIMSLGLLALFAAWNLLSALWALDTPAALAESTRVILYLLFSVATLAVVRSTGQARTALASYALGSAALAGITITQVALSDAPEHYFRWIKLAEPIGYYNTEATFLLMPAIVAVYLASARETLSWLRPLLYAGAGVLLSVAVLTQSRGGFWALVAGLAVYFALTPSRSRGLLWWTPLFVGIAWAFDALNQVHLDLDEGDLSALAVSVDKAARAVAAVALIAAVVGSVLTLLDLRVSLGRRTAIAAKAVTAAVFIGVLVVVPIRFPALTDPVSAARTAWEQFKGTEDSPAEESEVRILDLSGSKRYELWQVAWHAFEDAPAQGLGADNYAAEWNRARPLAHDVLQPHNLYLRLVSELGLPGLLLFLGAFAAAAASALVRAFRGARHERALIVATLSLCTIFLTHAAADWVWHMPSVALGFFMGLGILASADSWTRSDDDAGIPPHSADSDAGHTETRAWSYRGATPIAVAAVVAVIAIVLTLPQLVSSRFSERGESLVAQEEPDLALRAARWASILDPIDGRPHVIAANAHVLQGDMEAAEREFEAATRRDPTDYHTYLAWGDAVRDAGGDPLPLYEEAARLNPLSFEVRARTE